MPVILSAAKNLGGTAGTGSILRWARESAGWVEPFFTAKRFHRLAQGCRAAATLGNALGRTREPRRGSVATCVPGTAPQAVVSGDRRGHALRNPFGVHAARAYSQPGVAAARQPRAILLNRFAVGSGLTRRSTPLKGLPEKENVCGTASPA